MQPYSNGAISDRFLKTLRSCPAGSEVFNPEAYLGNFAGLNNPVIVNVDGTSMISSIFGRSYFDHAGYTTTHSYQADIGNINLTAADGVGSFIDTGERITSAGQNYKAFAIAWAPAPVVTGNHRRGAAAADDTAILQIDNKTPSARDKTWTINVTAGTVKAGVSVSLI